MVPLVPLVLRARMELMARSDHKVQWDLPVLLVPRVQLARRARMELMARSDRRVQRDQPVPLVRQAPRDLSGRKV